MKDINISFNGQYVFLEGNVYDTLNNIGFTEKECDVNFWLKFIKENSIFSNLNERMDTFSLNKMLRSVLYEISDRINSSNKYDLLCEFEKKCGSNLILEINNSLSFGKKLSEGWDFIIEKANEYGLIKEADDASGFNKWIETAGKTLIEKLRDAMFSPIGIGVQVALTAATGGLGAGIVSASWGVLLAYDIYMAIEGQPNWFNITFDILGMIPGITAVAKNLFRTLGTSAKAASSVEEVVGAIAQTKDSGKVMKVLGGLGKFLSFIFGKLKDGVSWIARKTGLTFLTKMSGKIFSYIQNLVGRFTNAVAKFSEGKAIIGAKLGGKAQNVGHALAKGGVETGTAYGIGKLLGGGSKSASPAPKPSVPQAQSNIDIAPSSDEAKIINILNSL